MNQAASNLQIRKELQRVKQSGWVLRAKKVEESRNKEQTEKWPFQGYFPYRDVSEILLASWNLATASSDLLEGHIFQANNLGFCLVIWNLSMSDTILGLLSFL